jgi:hypothetical protein
LRFGKRSNIKKGAQSGVNLQLKRNRKIMEMLIEGAFRGVSGLCIFCKEVGILIDPDHHFGVTIRTNNYMEEKPVLTGVLKKYPNLKYYDSEICVER